MAAAVVLVLVAVVLWKLLYAKANTAYWRSRTTATADRAGTHAPCAMTQAEIDEVVSDMMELHAHRDYTVAASSGRLPAIRLPLWKRVGTGLLFGDLAYHGVRDVVHHLDNDR